MKESQLIKERKLPKGSTIDPSLNGKYNNNPYFKKKLDEMNEFLRQHPVPKELLEQKQVK